MASVRARRRPPAPPEPPRRRRPQVEGIPRLAAIKLEGDWRGPGKITRRGVATFLAGCILMAGASVAGAAWLGGSLFDAHEAWAVQADRMAANAGFAARDIRIEGVEGQRAEEIRDVLMPDGRASLLAADPKLVKARIESLDWVAKARVTRRWPDQMLIVVERRAAFALWQEDGAVSVIDSAGERLLAERPADHPHLPLVVGPGAAHAAEPVLLALERLPALRTRTAALIRVGERRWNIELKSGVTIALPEADAPAAMARLEALHGAHALLDRPVERIDLRAPGLLAVRQNAPLLGGPIGHGA